MSPAHFIRRLGAVGKRISAALSLAASRAEAQRRFDELTRMSRGQLAALELPQSCLMVHIYES
jgi:hypothetical protein